MTRSARDRRDTMRIPHQQEVHLLVPATSHFSIRGTTRHHKIKVTVADLSWSGVGVSNGAAGVEVNRFSEVCPGKNARLVFKFGEHEVVIPGRVAWSKGAVAGIRLNLGIADASSRQAFRRWVTGVVQGLASRRPGRGDTSTALATELGTVFEPIEWLHMASETTPDRAGLTQIAACLRRCLEELPAQSAARALDSVVRALENAAQCPEGHLQAGVARAMDALRAGLSSMGATLLAPVAGDPVDENLHVVVGSHPQPGRQKGTIVATSRPGLQIGVRVMRSAQVKVAA